MESFSLLNNQVSFSDTIVNYNKIYTKYYNLAKQYSCEFEREYASFGSMKKLAENCNTVGVNYIKEGINQIINDLIKLRIYDVSIDEIVYKYGEQFFSDWFEAHDMVVDQYLSLEKNVQGLEQIRKLRSQNRGKFMGGGVGLSGAIKGMAIAGTLNMATGAVHGAVNMAGNVVTAIKGDIKASQMYNNVKNKEILKNGLFSTIFKLNYIYCDYANIGIPHFQPEKVDALLKNFINIPKCDKPQAIYDCLKYNPYNFSIYKQAINEYGDKENEIQLVADFFGLGKKVEDYKSTLLKSSCNLKNIDDIKDKTTALNLYNNLQKNAKLLGASDSSLMLSIKNKIESFDRQERTYKNHVYPDISSAKRAQVDDNFVNAQLKKISAWNTKEQLMNLQETIYSHCITEDIVSNAIKEIYKFIYLCDIIDNTENSKSEQVAYETLHIIERECEKNEEFESFYERIYSVILKIKYENLNFELYTMKNGKLMSEKLSDIKKEFGSIPECDITKKMQNVVTTNKIMLEKAKLYSDKKVTKLLPSSICLIVFTFLGKNIPVIGKYVSLFFVVIIIMTILGLIIQLINPTYDGIPKKECKRAYTYFKSNGESV